MVENEEKLKAMSDRITGREKQILKLISDGLTNKEIAYNLNLSIYTIDNHCKKIYRKLQVKDRIEAIELANKDGIID